MRTLRNESKKKKIDENIDSKEWGISKKNGDVQEWRKQLMWRYFFDINSL